MRTGLARPQVSPSHPLPFGSAAQGCRLAQQPQGTSPTGDRRCSVGGRSGGQKAFSEEPESGPVWECLHGRTLGGNERPPPQTPSPCGGGEAVAANLHPEGEPQSPLPLETRQHGVQGPALVGVLSKGEQKPAPSPLPTQDRG